MTTSRFDQLGESSKNKLLAAVIGSPSITFIRPYGNIGDHLIHAGTRQLLAGMPYREVSIVDVPNVGGDTALVGGCGGWCGPFHDMPAYLPLIEQRFERVIVLPSSFDISVECVRRALAGTTALVFAREEVSFNQIRNLCNADLALDCAFFFDFAPYRRHAGYGLLNAFRTDREAAPGTVPPDNNDISRTCESLDEWLWTITRYAIVRTDRAHVTIAAALLSKQVEYRSSNYHKVPAIVDYSLQGYPVHCMTSNGASENNPAWIVAEQRPTGCEPPTASGGHLAWTEALRLSVQDLAELVPEGASLVLVDDDNIGPLPLYSRRRLPFLERDGEYWGPPLDDATAVRELGRLRQGGATFIVFAWPAFWWLEYYSGLHEHLRTNFRCALHNDRLVAFDLRG